VLLQAAFAKKRSIPRQEHKEDGFKGCQHIISRERKEVELVSLLAVDLADEATGVKVVKILAFNSCLHSSLFSLAEGGSGQLDVMQKVGEPLLTFEARDVCGQARFLQRGNEADCLAGRKEGLECYVLQKVGPRKTNKQTNKQSDTKG